MDDGKYLFEKLVTDGNQCQFFILSFCYQSLTKLFAGKVTFDGDERAHVEDVAERFTALLADLASSPDAGAIQA